MKTLDEVIKACEETVSDVDRGVDIEGCYLGATETRDALHYLKEYQETKKHLACLDDAEIHGDDTQVVNNPALTWDDLKQMEGKPVWVEWASPRKHYREWFLLDVQGEGTIVFRAVNGDSLYLSECDLGKTWQAYRKERNE